MINKNLQKKGLVILTIALFFGMCVVTSAGNNEIKNNPSRFIQPLTIDPPSPYVFGDMGQNEWYISPVTVGFSYDPKYVMEIHYRIGNGNWNLYTGHFEISEDGAFVIHWYWLDEDWTQYNGAPIELKIDLTLPTITLEKSWSLDKTVITFEADVSDATSGVERVEFYLDDVFQETLTSPPYEWDYTKVVGESPIIVGTVYDFAGNSQSDDEDTTSHGLPYNIVFLGRFLQRMQSMVMWSQSALKLIFFLLR